MVTRKNLFLGVLAAVALFGVVSVGIIELINQVFLTQWMAGVLPEGILVRRIHMRWPCTVVVDYASWAAPGTPQAPWLQVPHATIDLFVTPLFVKRLVIRNVVLEQPRVTVHRDADGRWNLPPLRRPSAASSVAGRAVPAAKPRWSIAVLAAHVKQGVLVLDDQRIRDGFHGEVVDWDLAVRQPLMPWHGWRTQVETRGTAVLRAGHSTAPLALTGWVDLQAKDLDGTLTVKDFDIGAVEHYINQGRLTLRFYQAQASMTARLKAVRGDFTADCQTTLTNLTDGEVSIKGVRVLDVKDAVGGPDRIVHLHIVLRGPLQRPRAWRPRFIPTGEQTIKLLRPLFEGRKETIILKVLPQVAGEKAVQQIEGTITGATRGLRKQLKRWLQELPPVSMEASAPEEAPAPAELPSEIPPATSTATPAPAPMPSPEQQTPPTTEAAPATSAPAPSSADAPAAPEAGTSPSSSTTQEQTAAPTGAPAQ